jgi:hypothetical protein
MSEKILNRIPEETKIERHRAFLERRNKEPLIGCIRGWENLSRYVKDTEAFFPKGDVSAHDLSTGRFLQMYQTLAGTLDEPDDLFRTLEPLTFFPWAEAAVGCPVTYTGKNFWSSPVPEMKTQAGREQWISGMRDEIMGPDVTGTVSQNRVVPEISRPWLSKYGELLDFLSGHFGEQHPMGQSILRGPLDMAAAVFGDENMIYHLYDHPSMMKEFFDIATAVFLSFIDVLHERTPSFAQGTVMGSYYIWTPGTCVRHQEDAMALLSPDLYREFVHPLDCRIVSAADYSLFHMHSTGLHLLDVLLENEGLTIFQVSKDQGVDLMSILPGLKKIQDAGKCLVLKGKLSRDDMGVIKSSLDFRGLCIQAVVLDQKEADDFYSVFL